jgi:hypothetical protein
VNFWLSWTPVPARQLAEYDRGHRPSDGRRITALGENIFVSATANPRTGVMNIYTRFQTFNLIPVLTAFENVELSFPADQAFGTTTAGSRHDGFEPGDKNGSTICRSNSQADRNNASPSPARS